MSKTLTITLPDELEQALTQAASQTHQSPEDIILELLSQRLQSSATKTDSTPDPLQKLIGCITTDLTDVGEQHDRYLGQAYYQDIHSGE